MTSIETKQAYACEKKLVRARGVGWRVREMDELVLFFSLNKSNKEICNTKHFFKLGKKLSVSIKDSFI